MGREYIDCVCEVCNLIDLTFGVRLETKRYVSFVGHFMEFKIQV